MSLQTTKVDTVCMAANAAGYQCQLASSTGATSPAPLHSFKPCPSPTSYAGLADGSYQWQVRAAGAGLTNWGCHRCTLFIMFCGDAVSQRRSWHGALLGCHFRELAKSQTLTITCGRRCLHSVLAAPLECLLVRARPCVCAGYALVSAQLFTVDATRPVPTLTSAAAAGRGATFAFKATDVTPVTFQCQLDRADASAASADVQPVPGSTLLPSWNTTVPCGSPAVSFTALFSQNLVR